MTMAELVANRWKMVMPTALERAVSGHAGNTDDSIFMHIVCVQTAILMHV